MKQEWRKPELDSLNVSMTMKFHIPDPGCGDDPTSGDPSDPSGLDS